MDIDIDLAPQTDVDKLFPESIRAAMVDDGEYKPHLVGRYFQNIPKDKITGLAAIPYNIAELHGYIKIDMLSLKVLSLFESREELKRYVQREPDWSLLMNEHVVKYLFHLSRSHEVLKVIRPQSIDALADVLMLIRPNKKGLIPQYVMNPDKVKPLLEVKKDASDLKRSHAIPYAMTIVAQLNKIEDILKGANESEPSPAKARTD